jgi:hypothetical protein
MGRSIVLICNEEGADNPEYRGLELNRGCPFIENASATLLGVSAVHSAKTAADKTSLMMYCVVPNSCQEFSDTLFDGSNIVFLCQQFLLMCEFLVLITGG